MNNGKIKQISYRALSVFFIICTTLIVTKTVYADSREISFGQYGNGTINDSNYIDWWEFYGVAGSKVTIRMLKGVEDLDPYLELFFEMDGNWELLIYNDDIQNGYIDTLNAEINNYELPYTGTYTIGATRFGKEEGTSSGFYQIFLLCIGGNCGSGSADTDPSIDWISYGDKVSSYLDDLSEENGTTYENWWAFSGTAGDQATILMYKEAVSGKLDPYLELWYESDGGWEMLCSDDDSFGDSAGVGANIYSYELPYTGTYTIRATRYNKEEGTSSGNYIMELLCSGGNCESGSADTSSSSLNEGNGCTYYADWPTTSDPDRDCDGFSDDSETWFFDTYSPVLVLDEDEDDCTDDPVNDFEVLYQVSPYETDERYSRRGALISIVVLWNEDCGGYSNNPLGTGHSGDGETMRIWVTQSPIDSKWSLTGMLWRVHKDDWNYETKLYNARDGVYFDGHPLMYVSESKHAMYPKLSKCENYKWFLYEDCGEGEIIMLSDMNVSPGGNIYSRVVPSSHNVGEANSHNFDQLKESGDYSINFPEAYAWSDKYPNGAEMEFCGDFVSNDCSAGIFSKWWPDVDNVRYTDSVNFLKNN
jgi:hypothetical protein